MNQRGVEHRAFKVASVTGLSTVLSIALQILTVPICLKYWGAKSYGTWLALFSVFSMLQLTSGGYVNFVGNQLNLLYHQSKEAVQKTLASALVGVSILGGVQLLALAGLMAMQAMPVLLGEEGQGSDVWQINVAMLTLTLSWLLGSFYLGMVHRLLVPAGLMYQAAWWSLAAQLCMALAIVFAAMAGANLFVASLAYFIVNVGFAYMSAWYVRNKLPQYFPWWRGFSYEQGVRDLLHSIPQIISGLIQQGSTNGLVLLVSALAGAAAVPAFTTVRTLSNLWTNVTNVLTAPLLPEVVRFHAKQEHEKLLTVQQVHSVLVGGSVNLSILLAFPLLSTLFAYWTRQSVVLDSALLCALLGSVSLLNLGSMMNAFLAGVNHHKTIFLTTLMRGGIALGLGAVLMPLLGLSGLGLAVWVGELLSLALVFCYFYLHVKTTTSLRGVLRQWAPSLLGVCALMVFLALEALAVSNAVIHILCLMVVSMSVFWGWTLIDAEVRGRLIRLLAIRLRIKPA